MNENIAGSSPLKLYHHAYQLQYREHKIAAACDIYEQLIRQFPDSDVSAYASVQLQKIHAGEMTRRMARKQALPLAMVIVLAVNCACVVVLAVTLAVSMHGGRMRDAHYGRIAQALGKMYGGKDDDALDILKTAKISNPRDVIPFMLAAEIYRKNHEYLKARKEFETFRRLNPGDVLAEIEMERINEEEDAYIGNKMKKQEKVKTIPEEMVRQEDLEAKARAEEQRKRTTRAMPVKKPPKLLVPRDSISFF